MKKLITIALLLSSMVAQAGPIISGGPNVKKVNYDCSNGDTNLEVRMTGARGFGRLVDVETGDELSLNCRASNKKTDPVSAIVAVCRTMDESTLVKVIQSRGIVGLQAIVKNGADSASLICHFASNFSN